MSETINQIPFSTIRKKIRKELSRPQSAGASFPPVDFLPCDLKIWTGHDSDFFHQAFCHHRMILKIILAGKATTSIDAEALYSGEVTFTVTCDKACVVAIDNGEDSYTRLVCTTVGEEHQFTVTVSDADVTIAIALKGDCNLDGAIRSNDATSAKQAASSMKTLTGLKLMTVDNNGDGVIRSNEATKVAQVATGATSYAW